MLDKEPLCHMPEWVFVRPCIIGNTEITEILIDFVETGPCFGLLSLFLFPHTNRQMARLCHLSVHVNCWFGLCNCNSRRFYRNTKNSKCPNCSHSASMHLSVPSLVLVLIGGSRRMHSPSKTTVSVTPHWSNCITAKLNWFTKCNFIPVWSTTSVIWATSPWLLALQNK